ncbi:MAG TPA: phosphoribosylglycinamide formyltransferase [Candidatus Omnitrophota bacterium]|jgi:phosphoribosylglycinamide formyltransferase-1|nr:phosphoribosylglycinamide formyltransferase [Candidatus Omnitrophota bacterium]HPN56850.1 phosphoribosylglycinamide formyltransferase [Candidatus Omnitrophota bacterium]
MKRFAVFVSGNGSNLQAIIDACQKGQIKSQLALVVSSTDKAYALERAEKAGIPSLVFNVRDYTNKQSVDRDIVIHLKQEKIDFIVLAGYMRFLTPFFVKQYAMKILNIHPSLLPAFKGGSGLKDAFTYGAKVTGVTVHFVNEKIDNGAIIFQHAVPIKDDDTLESLEERIHRVEHKIYPEAIALFEEDRLKVKGRKVFINGGPSGEC